MFWINILQVKPKPKIGSKIQENLASCYKIWFNPPFLWKCLYQVRAIAGFPVFLLLTDFVCLLTYEFCLSLWKIARCSVILLLPLFNYVLRCRLRFPIGTINHSKYTNWLFTLYDISNHWAEFEEQNIGDQTIKLDNLLERLF